MTPPNRGRADIQLGELAARHTAVCKAAPCADGGVAGEVAASTTPNSAANRTASRTWSALAPASRASRTRRANDCSASGRLPRSTGVLLAAPARTVSVVAKTAASRKPRQLTGSGFTDGD
jgi:hypothetical protein